MSAKLRDQLVVGLMMVGITMIVILLVTLPFALIGWIFISLLGIFITPLASGYWTCVGAGMAVVILGAILRG